MGLIKAHSSCSVVPGQLCMRLISKSRLSSACCSVTGDGRFWSGLRMCVSKVDFFFQNGLHLSLFLQPCNLKAFNFQTIEKNSLQLNTNAVQRPE